MKAYIRRTMMGDKFYLIVKGRNGEASTSTFIAFTTERKANSYCVEMNDAAMDDIEYGYHVVYIQG